jgi:hypothetical protein
MNVKVVVNCGADFGASFCPAGKNGNASVLLPLCYVWFLKPY